MSREGCRQGFRLGYLYPFPVPRYPVSTRQALATFLFLSAVLFTTGCTSGIPPPPGNTGIPTGVHTTGIWVSVSSGNPWEGTVVVDGRTSTASGHGPSWIDISDDADFVTVRATKLDGSASRLEAGIWENGLLVAGGETVLPNGTVQVVHRFE